VSGHAFLPPSGAGAWVVCGLWPTMNATFPQDDSEHTLGGHAAHWVSSERFGGRDPLPGTLAPNGVVVDEEMAEAADVYVDDVRQTLGVNGLPFLVVEQPIEIPRVHPLNWGTPDAWAYVASTRTLFIWDFKFGHGYVDVYENWQLLNYVAGILDRKGLDGFEEQKTRVVMRVVQPRNYHRDGPVREWSANAADLRGYFNKLATAAEVATGPTPPARVGEHCEHCPGRHACPALQAAGYKLADVVRVAPPLELDDHAAALELMFLERAEAILGARISGLKAQVERRLRDGAPMPFYGLEQTFGRLAWTKPADEVFILGELFGVELRKPAEPITPTQAKKLGIDEAVLSAYAERPRTGVKLVADSTHKAKKVFGK